MRSIPRRALLAAGLGLAVEAGAYAAGCIARTAGAGRGRRAATRASADDTVSEDPSEELRALPDGAAGWLAVAGTSIDRPVMQAAGNPDFYLSHDEDGEPSAFGSLYLDQRCAPGHIHLMVYGHHVLDMPDEMFSPIHDAYLPEVFEGIGEARLQEAGSDSMGSWQALCALRVDSSFTEIQRFGLEGDGFRQWLEGIVATADARAVGADGLVAEAARCLTLVTCSSAVGGQRWRTLLLFAR